MDSGGFLMDFQRFSGILEGSLMDSEGFLGILIGFEGSLMDS